MPSHIANRAAALPQVDTPIVSGDFLPPTLFDVFAEFHRRFYSYGKATVGGGAVRDTLMGRTPKDFDVFIHAKLTGKDVEHACRDLVPIKSLPWHRSEPFLRGTFGWHGVEVQILSTEHKAPDELVDSFDWNVCLFAYDGAFVQRTDLSDIDVGKELRLNRVTFPLSTLRRGYRFSERFGMVLPAETAIELCVRVAADAIKEARGAV